MNKGTGKMTVEEAGKKGGEKTKATHNSEFFKRIGKKGGKKHAKTLRKYGVSQELHEKLSEAGHRGGEVTKSRHGTEFYQEIGRKGGSVPRMKETMEEITNDRS